MQSIKNFAESASLVQETMGDIKDQAQTLVDIALAETLSQIAEKANALFVALEPAALSIDRLVASLDKIGVSVVSLEDRATTASKQIGEFEWKWENTWLYRLLFGEPAPPPEPAPPQLPRGEAQLTDLEGGY